MPNLPTRPRGLLHRDQVVLCVIDIQDRLLPAIPDGPRMVKNIIKLIRFFQLLDLPIVLTEQGKLGETVPEIREVLPGMEPIVKRAFGCMGCEEFATRVAEIGRDTLVLVGIEAHICVAQTGLGALPRYGVHLISDAVSSRSEHNTQVALQRLAQSGAVISSTEMIMYELLREAGTDEFREALKLVKE